MCLISAEPPSQFDTPHSEGHCNFTFKRFMFGENQQHNIIVIGPSANISSWAVSLPQTQAHTCAHTYTQALTTPG